MLIYTYTYTCFCSCIHFVVYICIHISIGMLVRTERVAELLLRRAHILITIGMHWYICMQICIYIMCVYIYMYIYIYIYIYVCTYIHTYTYLTHAYMYIRTYIHIHTHTTISDWGFSSVDMHVYSIFGDVTWSNGDIDELMLWCWQSFLLFNLLAIGP